MNVVADQPSGVDVREACLEAALALISSESARTFSLEEVARHLAVPDDVPGQFFESADHLRAVLVERAFREFTQALLRPKRTDDAAADVMAMGMAYLTFAAVEPAKYRLMFGGVTPDHAVHRNMAHAGREAFDIVRSAMARLLEARGEPMERELIDLEAMFAWSSLHGIASLAHAEAIDMIGLPPQVRSAFAGHSLLKVGIALGIDVYRRSGERQAQ